MSNIIKNINNILLSALTVKQKQLVDEIIRRNGNILLNRYDHIFGVGNKRIYLPDIIKIDKKSILNRLINDGMIIDDTIIINLYIELFFIYLHRKLDFKITPLNYIEGKFTSGNREYNIGKLLNEIVTNADKIINYIENNKKNPDIIKMNIDSNFIDNIQFGCGRAIQRFNSRPSITNLNFDINYKIVISRDPYDIAGMSTDRKWTSCMELPTEFGAKTLRRRNGERGGSYRFYIINDLTEGSLIAYLINEKDKDIEDPVARVLIKPFINRLDNNQIFLSPEDKVYRDYAFSIDQKAIDKFLSVVNDWVNEQQKDLEGIFIANPKLYPDGKKKIHKGLKLNLDIDEAIRQSIDWDSFFINNCNIIRGFLKTEYTKKLDDLIKAWNGLINANDFKQPLNKRDRKLFPIIDIDKITSDDRLKLDFPCIQQVKEKYPGQNINYDRVSIEDMIYILENHIYSKWDHTNFVNSLKELKHSYDTNKIETYDLIVMREPNKTYNDINNIDYDDLDISKYVNVNTIMSNIFNNGSNFLSYLYTAYVVSPGTKNLNNVLMRFNVLLNVDGSDIKYKSINYILDELSDDFFDYDILNYFINDEDKFYVNSEFDKYLDFKNKKDPDFLINFSECLDIGLTKILDCLSLDTAKLAKLYDFDDDIDDDENDERLERESILQDKMKDIEDEIFTSDDLEEEYEDDDEDE